MSFTKTVAIRVLTDTWPNTAVPPALAALQNARRYSIDVLACIAFTALWTRPPVRYGFSLADCWAWLRYLPSIDFGADLRLREEWTSLDPHQKTVLSGDFGVGFGTWFLNRTLGLVRFSDTLWVVNTLLPGAFHLEPGKKRGPAKSPDYIAEDANGNFSVVECKGTQTSRQSLRDAMQRGIPQKDNLRAIGATPIQHSLVVGLFVPQFENSERPVIMVADPEWSDLKDRLTSFSPEQIGRGVSQVAYAKELAMFDLPNTANSLVGVKGSSESVAAAFSVDADTPSRGRTIDGSTVRFRQEYTWSTPARVAETLRIRGVRFEGTLAEDSVAALREVIKPEEHGIRERDGSRRRDWDVREQETSVALTSPLGTRFRLSLLEA